MLSAGLRLLTKSALCYNQQWLKVSTGNQVYIGYSVVIADTLDGYQPG